MSDPAHTPVPEATLERTEHGLVPTSEGWYILNLSDAVARLNPDAGTRLRLEATDQLWPQLGLNIRILEPGQAACRYHEEGEQEAFLVLSGACLAIVEDEEVPLRPWDVLHCPPGTRHVLVGAGDGPCAVLMIGARPWQADALVYPISDVAARYHASVATPTALPEEAYADWPGPSSEGPSPWPPADG
ncbi:MAG: cupin domain-containing protein [Gaiellales bacterium]